MEPGHKRLHAETLPTDPVNVIQIVQAKFECWIELFLYRFGSFNHPAGVWQGD